jgi:hypothetical protein
LPLFIADEPDFMSVPDFVSVAEEPAPVPDPVAGDVADGLPLGLADGDVLLEGDVLLSVPGLVAPPVLGLPLVAPAPDVDPLPEPLAPPAPPLWANADVASIAPATVSASALIHVFIAVLLGLL